MIIDGTNQELTNK
ncbi:Protein of unknown function [Bacillus wiedmannii]|uniref:Uncharacterized protein n=2 Tax=Bacillus cereus group TaxID=86661 RepID=A0A1C4EGT5_BACTU|nr:Protein of unknown function [Bacillus wiedmannii]SCC42846.1 Protein of unknown function [Bacillus thuringiensis]SCL98356.1 Protein of unknown function [Bacillus wiedmannii]